MTARERLKELGYTMRRESSTFVLFEHIVDITESRTLNIDKVNGEFCLMATIGDEDYMPFYAKPDLAIAIVELLKELGI